MTSGDSTFVSSLGQIDAIRVVSAGIRVWDVAKMTSVGGWVCLNEFSNLSSYLAASGGLITAGDMTASPVSGCFDRRQEVVWLSRPTDQAAYQFSDSATSTDEINNRRSGVCISVSGPASETAICYEWVVNYEVKLNAETLLGRVARPVPDTPPMSLARRAKAYIESKVSSMYGGAKEQFNRFIEGKAKDALMDLAGRGISGAIGGYLGGPGGAVAASSSYGALTNYAYNAIDVD
jgi:hypothetical protein